LIGTAETTTRYHIVGAFSPQLRAAPIVSLLSSTFQIRQVQTNINPASHTLAAGNYKISGFLAVIDITGVTLTAGQEIIVNTTGIYVIQADAEL